MQTDNDMRNAGDDDRAIKNYLLSVSIDNMQEAHDILDTHFLKRHTVRHGLLFHHGFSNYIRTFYLKAFNIEEINQISLMFSHLQTHVSEVE